MNKFESLCLRGRRINADVLADIRATIATHWDCGRSAISRILCQQWNWRQSNGHLKDMACRDLLLRLERMELIVLPARQRKKVNRKRIAPVPPGFEDSSHCRVGGGVEAYQSLDIAMVRGGPDESLWDSLVDRYHYLGCRPIVGAYLKYLVYLDGQLVACLGWGSAAWKVACRDRFIGWNDSQRRRHLNAIANNVRFLILPWVQVHNLASKTLALCSRILLRDWKRVFAEELVLLETFVDRARFLGTSYRAANWLYLGQTKGSAKRGAAYHRHGHRKAVFVYALRHDFRKRLCR